MALKYYVNLRLQRYCERSEQPRNDRHRTERAETECQSQAVNSENWTCKLRRKFASITPGFNELGWSKYAWKRKSFLLMK